MTTVEAKPVHLPVPDTRGEWSDGGHRSRREGAIASISAGIVACENAPVHTRRVQHASGLGT